MKIAHSGDWHLTSGPRFVETLAVLLWMARDAEAQGAELFLCGGDLAGTVVPYRMTEEERLGLAEVFLAITSAMPLVVIYGNHDAPLSLDLFAALDTAHPIHVVTTRCRFVVGAKEAVDVVAVPYPQKRELLRGEDFALDMASQTRLARERLVADLGQLLDAPVAGRRRSGDGHVAGLPLVLLGHFTVDGVIVGGGEVLFGEHEIGLSRAELADIEGRVDAVFLSHIHKAQDAYAGSPSAQNFGEQTDLKGYALVELRPKGAAVRTFRYTPAPRLLTIPAIYEDGAWAIGWPMEADALQGAEVRVRATIPEAAAEVADTEAVRVEVLRRGARLVQVERRLVPTMRVRSEAMAATVTVGQKLDAWFASLDPGLGAEVTARLHDKLQQLQGGGSHGDTDAIRAAADGTGHAAPRRRRRLGVAVASGD